MKRPAGYIIDVPVTLSVAVRGEGLTAAQAKGIARKFADDLNPSQQYVDGYSSVIEKTHGPTYGSTITEVTLESTREECCEVLDKLEVDDEEQLGPPAISLPGLFSQRRKAGGR